MMAVADQERYLVPYVMLERVCFLLEPHEEWVVNLLAFIDKKKNIQTLIIFTHGSWQQGKVDSSCVG
ncbi:hypothetical protein L6164_003654 [Bauhinia variegata]|uniref:Uncharacterized protein n=1 Tax=Bauhinia variegata TaxID=167791 RepID=A0ACB9Q1Z8_BAUVA|nr:hypothetical protein L6164_003654 [Bauhinia variegata]